ncbi:caspase, EACC1-associated type, partial [Actinomadura rayongensis]
MSLPDPAASRAVLIGTHSGCQDLGTWAGDLPSVARNTSRLQRLLTDGTVWGLSPEHCVELSQPEDERTVLDEVKRAARDATDTLLVYYAGHGMLVGPGDDLYLALPGVDEPDQCLAYAHLSGRIVSNRSGSLRTVVILDCCFSGAAFRGQMGADQPPKKLQEQVAEKAEFHGACVLTASAETQPALAPPDDEFTVFTGELINIMSEGIDGGPEFLDTGTLHGELKKRLALRPATPEPQFGTRGQGGRIVLARNRAHPAARKATGLRARNPADEDPWVTGVRDNPVWRMVADENGLGADELRAAAASFAGELSRSHSAARAKFEDSPWCDPMLAPRTAERLNFLIDQLGADFTLSSAEAALLTVTPFLHATVHAIHLARNVLSPPPSTWLAETEDDAVQIFAQFCRDYFSRQYRRTETLIDDTARSALNWWLLQRMTRHDMQLHPHHVETTLTELVGAARIGAGYSDADRLVREVFERLRLAVLTQAMDLGPERLAEAEGAFKSFRRRVTLRASTGWEKHVREQLLGHLLVLARKMAIDPADLGETLVGHIGTRRNGLDARTVRETVADSSWVPWHRNRVLNARCHHQAVAVALADHVGIVAGVLKVIHSAADTRTDLAVLGRLPDTVGADNIGPADTGDGRPAYDSPGLRFRLDDEKVRELLMGEQLYHDRTLAIRELYQNALDACRYRWARSEYLRRKGHDLAPYNGRIEFSQGSDDYGPFIECEDNGIGLDVHGLKDVFSRAGARFTDLPEFLQERAEWEALDEPIELFPNSRFGIGVLSYFMLADEIVVTTCRMGRKGEPGEILEVTISGPGTIFHINRIGPGVAPFTRVRLYLNRSIVPPSTVDVLRRLLWVAEFNTTADSGTEKEVWVPGELSPRAPIGAEDPLRVGARRTVDDVVGDSSDQVWWCGGPGAVLADGLWAGRNIYGAVVNLRGPIAPTLSVDRRNMLDYDEPAVKNLLSSAVDRIVAMPSRDEREPLEVSEPNGRYAVGSYLWLSRLAADRPFLADSIVLRLAANTNHCWRIGGIAIPISIFGCFPSDILDNYFPWMGEGAYRSDLWGFGRAAGRVGAWRRAVFVDLLEKRPSPLVHFKDISLPSDAFILAGYASGSITRTHIIGAAARLNISVSRVVERLVGWGFEVPGSAGLPDTVPLEDDAVLLSRDADGRPPWLVDGEPIPISHVVQVGLRLRWRVPQVVERLVGWGFE